MLRFYKTGTADEARDEAKLRKSLGAAGAKLSSLVQERCYMVELTPGTALSGDDESRLLWLIAETFEPEKTARASFLKPGKGATLLEIGPRLTFCTAWCSNAVSICAACGLGQVARIEVSRRYLFAGSPALGAADVARHAAALHDRMTEQIYPTPLESFASDAAAVPTRTIPLMTEGRAALEKLSNELGLGFDEADLVYYTNLFVTELKRDPTDVECFDMAQVPH